LVYLFFSICLALFYPYWTAFGFPEFATWEFQTLIVGELCQLVNIILNFFKAYTEEGNEDFEMNFFKISDKYIKEELKTDLLIFIPFGLIGHISPYFSNWKILWSIKVARINELTDILD
jgi:hypothetical protein